MGAVLSYSRWTEGKSRSMMLWTFINPEWICLEAICNNSLNLRILESLDGKTLSLKSTTPRSKDLPGSQVQRAIHNTLTDIDDIIMPSQPRLATTQSLYCIILWFIMTTSTVYNQRITSRPVLFCWQCLTRHTHAHSTHTYTYKHT